MDKTTVIKFKNVSKNIAKSPLSFQIWEDGTIYVFGSEKATLDIFDYFYPKYMERGYSPKLGSWYLIVNNLKNINPAKLA